MATKEPLDRSSSDNTGLGRRVRPVLLTVAALLMCEQSARAYVDPGAGTLVWQMVVAGLVGGLFYLRKVTTWLRGRDRRQ